MIKMTPELNKKLEHLYESLELKKRLKNPFIINDETIRMIEDHIKVVQSGESIELYDGKYSHANLQMIAEDRCNVGAGKYQFFISTHTYPSCGGDDDSDTKYYPKFNGPWFFHEPNDILVLSLFAHYQYLFTIDRINESHTLDVMSGKSDYISWDYSELDEWSKQRKLKEGVKL